MNEHLQDLKGKLIVSDPEFQDLLAIRHRTTTSNLVLVDGCS